MTSDENEFDAADITRALTGFVPVDQHLRLIGEFFYEFSQVEFSLRFTLSRITALPDDYFDIVTAPYDTNTLCNVIKALAKKAAHPTLADPVIEVAKRFQKLNEHRVRIAHGTWSEDIDGLSSRHVSRTSLEPSWHYGKSDELAKLVREAKALQEDLLVASVALISNMDATRRLKD